ncbi:hypothetical protein AAH678_14160 [Sodalis endosymbiont of Spalangia cameroni]|uniref:hypothetical protein n=1 Tax=Sodalis praecaptivus TaxID=1239307 RepID=UPI0031F91021
MTNQRIAIRGEVTVRAAEIAKVWVSNGGEVFIKLCGGAVHAVALLHGETPFQTSMRIKAQIKAARA